MRCSAPPPLNVDEARKIRVRHSPPPREPPPALGSRRKSSCLDRIALSFASTSGGSQIRRSPRLLACASKLPRGMVEAMTSNAALGTQDSYHALDIGAGRAGRQRFISPARQQRNRRS